MMRHRWAGDWFLVLLAIAVAVAVFGWWQPDTPQGCGVEGLEATCKR